MPSGTRWRATAMAASTVASAWSTGSVITGGFTGVLPATGSVIALITAATNRRPYVVGKPNPMMFRSALNKIGAHSEETGMIGDRMDTDIVAGMEAGLHTVLVLTGISTTSSMTQFPYRPVEILDGVHQMLAGATPADDGA